MTYIDILKYKKFESNKEEWLRNRHVVNFDIIDNQYRGDELKKSIAKYKTVSEKDLKTCPQKKELEALSSIRRVNRQDIFLTKSLSKKF